MAIDPIPLLPQPCPLTFLPVHSEKIQLEGGKFEDITEIQAKKGDAGHHQKEKFQRSFQQWKRL